MLGFGNFHHPKTLLLIRRPRLVNVDLEKNRINFELVPTPVHAKVTQIGKSAPKTKQKKTNLRSTSKKRR